MAIKQGKEQVIPVLSKWTSLRILCVFLLLHVALMTVAQPGDSHHVSGSKRPHVVHPSVHRRSRPHIDNPNPNFRYMYELYKMMVRQEKDCCMPYKGDNHKTETITGIPGVAGGDFSNRYFSFNVSSLHDSDNTTLVQVAVATRSRRHSACHVGLEVVEDSSIERPTCQHNPFNISHLDVFNVTSALESRLMSRDEEFMVYMASADYIHVRSAILVVFRDIDPDELMNRQCQPCSAGQSLGEEEDPSSIIFPPASRLERRRRDTANLMGRVVTKEEEGRDLSLTGFPSNGKEDTSISGFSGQHPLSSSPSAHDLMRILHQRRRRYAEQNVSATYERPDSVCRVTELILHPMHDLGMDNVISPEMFRINVCSGHCPVLLLPQANRTYHSYLTSYFTMLFPEEAAQRQPPIPRPRCIPSAYSPMSVFLETNETIYVARWWDAIVRQCKCV